MECTLPNYRSRNGRFMTIIFYAKKNLAIDKGFPLNRLDHYSEMSPIIEWSGIQITI